jgi:hypothetical protein
MSLFTFRGISSELPGILVTSNWFIDKIVDAVSAKKVAHISGYDYRVSDN